MQGFAPKSLTEKAINELRGLRASLRAQRSNPESGEVETGLLRRFAPRNDEKRPILLRPGRKDKNISKLMAIKAAINRRAMVIACQVLRSPLKGSSDGRGFHRTRPHGCANGAEPDEGWPSRHRLQPHARQGGSFGARGRTSRRPGRRCVPR